MHSMLQLFVVILAIIAVTSHEYGSSHHSGGDTYSGPSRSMADVRTFGGSVGGGRSNTGWGNSKGYGTNTKSYHSNDFLDRSNCDSNNYGFGGRASNFRSTW